jgi:hypothetical protein
VRAASWRPRRWQSEQIRQSMAASGGGGTMNARNESGLPAPRSGTAAGTVNGQSEATA